ncbi:MAG: hypothetical protein LBR47_04220 [Spirochaetaceae bacterium]|nr:hypothetical protein [Spirochaetaceae bacterium]
MKRLLTVIISIIALSVPSVLSAQETGTNSADISIRFFDKTIYYTDSAVADNPIQVRITIANSGSRTIRFKLAEDRIFSTDFAAYTVKNMPLIHTDGFIRKRSTNQPVFFREISLEPGEQYSFVENVRDYLKISEPGVYYLENWFYPELNRLEIPAGSLAAFNSSTVAQAVSPIRSNRLTLEIRPAPSAAGGALPVSPETKDILRPEQIPPDQIISYTLTSRQRSLWDQYFLYMDVEEMLLRDPARNRRYRAESADGRARMLEDYKLDLRQDRIDRDIVAIPESFQIEKTMYTTTEGTVSVLEWFSYDGFQEKKRYTYFLRQRDGIWHIYDYTVDNLGTE